MLFFHAGINETFKKINNSHFVVKRLYLFLLITLLWNTYI